MANWHLNPETGEPGKCSADPSNPRSTGCRYASSDTDVVHFSANTLREAQQRAEKTIAELEAKAFAIQEKQQKQQEQDEKDKELADYTKDIKKLMKLSLSDNQEVRDTVALNIIANADELGASDEQLEKIFVNIIDKGLSDKSANYLAEKAISTKVITALTDYALKPDDSGFLSSGNVSLLSTIVYNKNTDAESLDRIERALKSSRGYDVRKIKQRILWHDNISEKTQIDAASDEDVEIRNFLSKNSSSEKVLEILANDSNAGIRYNVAESWKATNKIIDELAFDDDSSIRSVAASSDVISPAILTELSDDKEYFVRSSVASNPLTASEVLDKLAKDEDSTVWRPVVANSNTSAETLEYLMKNRLKVSTGTFSRLLENKNANGKTLEMAVKMLSEEKKIDPDDLRLIAKHPNATANCLKVIAQVPDVEIRVALAKNINIPKEVFEILAKSRSPKVLKALQNNPNTPMKILLKIASKSKENDEE